MADSTITNLPAKGAVLDPTDKLAIDEVGAPTTTKHITGQELADGVKNNLNLAAQQVVFGENTGGGINQSPNFIYSENLGEILMNIPSGVSVSTPAMRIAYSEATAVGANVQIRLVGGTTGGAGIFFGEQSGAGATDDKATITYDNSSEKMEFRINQSGSGAVSTMTIDGINQSVGLGTLSPDPSTILDLVSPNNDSGLGLTSLTTTQINNISSPKEGMILYDNVLKKGVLRTDSAYLEFPAVPPPLLTLAPGDLRVGLSVPALIFAAGSQAVALDFAVGNDVGWTLKLSTNYIDNTDINITIMWAPETAAGGSVDFDLLVNVRQNGDLLIGGPDFSSTIGTAVPAINVFTSTTFVVPGIAQSIVKEDYLSFNLTMLGTGTYTDKCRAVSIILN